MVVGREWCKLVYNYPHLIVYRITDCRIEVLDIIHAASSMNRIKHTRRIKIE